MGGGSYSTTLRSDRHVKSKKAFVNTDGMTDYSMSFSNDFFKQSSINNAMNPKDISLRESRDSEEHPNSVAIIIALDTTGSMGSIPFHLVKEGLPNIMDKIIQAGVPDPQVLFLGIGDHECDSYPLQVGQFESSDELLDTWLESVYLERGGGGNGGESYGLAWYFAGSHTAIDCLEKRKQKGFLFTIGDEPILEHYPKSMLKNLMGDGEYQDFTHQDLLERAEKLYNVYHVHLKETGAGRRYEDNPVWKELLQDKYLAIDTHEEISHLIADKIIEGLKIEPTEIKSEVESSVNDEQDSKEDVIL